MDDLAISEAFLDLNAAWMRNSEAFATYCRSFKAAILSANEAVSGKLHHDRQKAPDHVHNAEFIMHWVNSLTWSSRHYHQMISKWLTDYVLLAPGISADTRQRALFWTRQALAMFAPSNFFWTNPRAVKRLVDGDRGSIAQGLRNWINDLLHGRDLPELTDRAAYRVGENLATTPGQVVYRNPLLELIQYAPQTPKTWQIPIVLIQPWINKYYIFDLTPQTSLIGFLVRQGFTVFVTSWKNPNADMAHIAFEDYMIHGALRAVTAARAICRSDTVHAAGYCIGGTLLACLMGWLACEPQKQTIADATFFATLLDFAEPGDLKVFVNATSIEALTQLVASEGVLNSRRMALAFRMLNPDDLIWRKMANCYFFGESPPRSDLLFWNSDGTHLPGAMCLFYLKSFYLENRLVKPKHLIVANRPIDLKKVRQPIYAVGALQDHICPWPATFQTCRLISGPVRYILANEGHITGIVNPPSPWSKKKYRAGAATRRRDPNRWLQNKESITGSWWPDWIAWLKLRSGTLVAPPAMGSERYKPLGPAPGRYVLE